MLFGPHHDITLAERDEQCARVQPDWITIYGLPILCTCRSREAVVTEVAVTVMREIW